MKFKIFLSKSILICFSFFIAIQSQNTQNYQGNNTNFLATYNNDNDNSEDSDNNSNNTSSSNLPNESNLLNLTTNEDIENFRIRFNQANQPQILNNLNTNAPNLNEIDINNPDQSKYF